MKLPVGKIVEGDAMAVLQHLPKSSVDCVVTSPPYFRLRDYDHDGQLGLEPHVDDWVRELQAVTRALRRVLRPSGTLWLNLGDSYATHPREGARRKSLVAAPERLMLALIDDGWIVRNKIVWAKTNPMPTSVKDRLSTTHEVIYLLSQSERYYFNLDAIRQPHRTRPPTRRKETARPPTRPDSRRPAWLGPNSDGDQGLAALKAAGRVGHPLGKNPGDVWQVATSRYPGAHFATYPDQLIQRILQAGCPPGGIVLDPFMGAGTTAVVAEQLGRQWVGIELNPEFIRQAEARLEAERTKRHQPKRKEVT